MLHVLFCVCVNCGGREIEPYFVLEQDMSLLETTEASASGTSGLLACATSEGALLAWELLVKVPSGGAPSTEMAAEISISDPPVVSVGGGGAQR